MNFFAAFFPHLSPFGQLQMAMEASRLHHEPSEKELLMATTDEEAAALFSKLSQEHSWPADMSSLVGPALKHRYLKHVKDLDLSSIDPNNQATLELFSRLSFDEVGLIANSLNQASRALNLNDLTLLKIHHLALTILQKALDTERYKDKVNLAQSLRKKSHPDLTLCHRLLQEGAEFGLQEAYAPYIEMCLQGKENNEDFHELRRVLEIGVSHGYDVAMIELGKMLCLGQGALSFYKTACEPDTPKQSITWPRSIITVQKKMNIAVTSKAFFKRPGARDTTHHEFY